MEYFSTGIEAVDQLGRLSITGDITPRIWQKTIVNENGKPQRLAMDILAEIVYWYRPLEVRDERTGEVLGWKKKFKGKMLQKGIPYFEETYGESEKTIRRTLEFLEKLGVIKRHYTSLRLKSGTVTGKVLFIELLTDRLYELTYPKKEEIVNMADTLYEDEFEEYEEEPCKIVSFTERSKMSTPPDKNDRSVEPEDEYRTVKNVQSSGQKCPVGDENEEQTVPPNGQKRMFGDTEDDGPMVKNGQKGTVFGENEADQTVKTVLPNGQKSPFGDESEAHRTVKFVQHDRSKCPFGDTEQPSPNGQKCPEQRTNLSTVTDKNDRYTYITTNITTEREQQTSIPLSHPSGKTAGSKEDKIDSMDGSEERRRTISLIKKNIGYDDGLLNDFDPEVRARYEEMYRLILDVISIPEEEIKVNGKVYPYAVVRERFLSLRQEHLIYVADCMYENYSKVKNMRAYLITALYNAPDTYQNYVAQSSRALDQSPYISEYESKWKKQMVKLKELRQRNPEECRAYMHRIEADRAAGGDGFID